MDIEQLPSEQDGGEAPLSIAQQLTHHDWKVRQQGLRAAAEGAELDSEAQEALERDYDTAFNESNPENQKLVLQVYTQAVEKGLMQLKFEKRAFWYNFVDKFLAGGKGAVKEQAEAFKVLAMKQCEGLLDSCVYLLAKNNAKISKEVLRMLIDDFSSFAFGAKQSELAPVLDKSLTNTNADIRAQTFQLIKLLAESAGIDMSTSLKNLKKPQLEELAQLKPTAQTKKGAGNAAKRRMGTVLTPDAFKASATTSILGTYSENWAEKVIGTAKWSEKKAMVDQLIKAADVPRLASGDYAHLLKLSKILAADSNIQVQICGLRVIGALAKGLRHAFRPLLRPNLDVLVAKLKDRKNTVIDALLDTFQHVFFCLSVEELYEELSVFNAKRNKDVRIVVVKLMRHYFDFILESENLRNLEMFIDLFAKSINSYYEDPDIEVRSAVNELVLCVQEQLDGRDELYAFNKCIDLAKVKKPRARSLDKIQGSGHKAKRSPTATQKPHKPLMDISPLDLSKNALEVPLYSFKDVDISQEAVEAKVNELFGAELVKKLHDSNWKVKTDALSQFVVMISNSNVRLDSYATFCIGKLLEAELRDFSESNIMVLKETTQLFLALIQSCENPETLFFYVAKFAARKAGEPKLHLAGLVTPAAEKLPYHIVFSLLSKQVAENKNPKALAEVNEMLTSLLRKSATFVFRDIKEHFRLMFNHNNPLVRTTGLTLFKAYHVSFLDKAEAIIG